MTDKDPDGPIVKPTSVDLRVGPQYIDCQEKPVRVKTRAAETGAAITLPPLGAVIFSTRESIHTPSNVVGRFDLKIAYAMRGLVLQVGPQIEPDYEGPLFGLLINLSDAEISLTDDALLTAEFSMLPSPNVPAAENKKKKKLADLGDYLQRNGEVVRSIRTTRLAAVQRDIEAHTSAANEARREVATFRSEMNAMRSQRLQRIGIGAAASVAVISLVISVTGLILAVIRTSPTLSQPNSNPAASPSNTSPASGTTINVISIPGGGSPGVTSTLSEPSLGRAKNTPGTLCDPVPRERRSCLPPFQKPIGDERP